MREVNKDYPIVQQVVENAMKQPQYVETPMQQPQYPQVNPDMMALLEEIKRMNEKMATMERQQLIPPIRQRKPIDWKKIFLNVIHKLGRWGGYMCLAGSGVFLPYGWYITSISFFIVGIIILAEMQFIEVKHKIVPMWHKLEAKQ